MLVHPVGRLSNCVSRKARPLEVLPFPVEMKSEVHVRFSMPRLAAVWFAIGLSATGMSVGLAAQTRATAQAANPVADPNAVITIGNARFTVLTPQLIRMEWAADGKFEDHASFVFLNRRLPVPDFEALNAASGPRQRLTIKTSVPTQPNT